MIHILETIAIRMSSSKYKRIYYREGFDDYDDDDDYDMNAIVIVIVIVIVFVTPYYRYCYCYCYCYCFCYLIASIFFKRLLPLALGHKETFALFTV